MTPRSVLVRDLLLLALGICVAFVSLVVVALVWRGAFTWVWFARVIFVSALVVGGLVLLWLPRIFRARFVRGSPYRRVDRAPGYIMALLLVLIFLGLFVCGGLMEWWFEWR